MMDKHIIKLTLRPFLYAAFIAVGFLGLILNLEYTAGEGFISLSLLIYILVVFELYTTANHYHVFHKENTDAIYEFEDHRIIQYAHHLLLPTLLYVFLVLFLYFHQEPSLYVLILVTTFFLFFILFENIHSFYKHKFSLNRATHYIYDLITIVLVFLGVAGMLELEMNTDIRISKLFIIFISLLTILNLLSISRHIISRLTILLAIGFAIFLSIVFYLNTFGFVSPLLLAFIASVIEYGFISTLNQMLDGIKITKEEILEYLILLMLLVSLVLLNVG